MWGNVTIVSNCKVINWLAFACAWVESGCEGNCMDEAHCLRISKARNLHVVKGGQCSCSSSYFSLLNYFPRARDSTNGKEGEKGEQVAKKTGQGGGGGNETRGAVLDGTEGIG